jgi:hypothetical protein
MDVNEQGYNQFYYGDRADELGADRSSEPCEMFTRGQVANLLSYVAGRWQHRTNDLINDIDKYFNGIISDWLKEQVK